MDMSTRYWLQTDKGLYGKASIIPISKCSISVCYKYVYIYLHSPLGDECFACYCHLRPPPPLSLPSLALSTPNTIGATSSAHVSTSLILSPSWERILLSFSFLPACLPACLPLRTKGILEGQAIMGASTPVCGTVSQETDPYPSPPPAASVHLRDTPRPRPRPLLLSLPSWPCLLAVACLSLDHLQGSQSSWPTQSKRRERKM